VQEQCQTLPDLASWRASCVQLGAMHQATESRTIPIHDVGTTSVRQRVVKVRRDYNRWVASETMEDDALRFAARAHRRWSAWRVANTAFGASSFLVLEAVGATLLLQFGFVNAAWAILATGGVIALAGLPISVYAARHGLDMDLLTRGAGFGYIGSTITSLIYASFTFIFFALEAAVMAYALELAFDIPPAWGYLVCALVVIPLVTHGVTVISRLQVWTQPLWLAMLLLPYVVVFQKNPGLLGDLVQYGGQPGLTQFDWKAFGAAMTVGIALITQMGEQADYLRFMPEPGPDARSRWRWWLGTLVGGPGWVVPGVLKMLGGALLAFLAIGLMVPPERAVDPNQMYLAAWEHVFPRYGWAVAATALFVVVSQLKINVTNAYAGSLAWSNFFSRVAHSHPGRVVWVVFNTGIALVLMELDVFQAMGGVLGLYANIAIAWMMAVVADLVINKPLGLSPPGIEFKRAHLYDINPVGVGAMGIASALSVAAYLGLFGAMAQAWSAAIALVAALGAAPLIAWATRGCWYLARGPQAEAARQALARGERRPWAGGRSLATVSDDDGAYRRLAAVQQRCVVCERDYEGEDVAQCPAYGGPICSLCCTLDARCHDLCKPEARLAVQWAALLRRVLPRRAWPYLDKGLGHYLLLMLLLGPALALLFTLLFEQEMRLLGLHEDLPAGLLLGVVGPALQAGFVKACAALLLVGGVFAWWLVLAHQSREVAQEEANRQTQALNEQAEVLRAEIESHRRTDAQLQEARRVAELARAQAEAASGAKTRYITTISHELRTPLNAILGYAQLLEEDDAMPAHRRQAVAVIRRGGDHLLSLIEGTLDLARIESGKLTLDVRPMRLRDCMGEIAGLFELQARAKGIRFRHEFSAHLPAVARADERRLRQILINLLGNAVKFTPAGGAGEVRLGIQYSGQMARIEISDTGPGMSAAELARVFEPFERGSGAGSEGAAGAAAVVGGTGLGLTISKMLTDLMGGEMTVRSAPGEGTRFFLRLFLPAVEGAELPAAAQGMGRTDLARQRRGYLGPRRRILVVDNEEADRGLLVSLLQPLGFTIDLAASGDAALALLAAATPEALPDAVFMDLAMPGIDGWETLRRLRRTRAVAGLPELPAAIVSANAFDRALDNDVGITPADFIVKPVRLGELLDWLERRLALQWTETAGGAEAPAAWLATARQDPPGAALVFPPADQLQALGEQVGLGYLRGALRCLDAIASADPAHAPFVERMRSFARAFQLDAMAALLQQGPIPSPPDTDTATETP
jgi:signal transduction histidine kinase/purine-cytosine permease-like protein/DNA-binding NarL/FixJ family response regulator